MSYSLLVYVQDADLYLDRAFESVLSSAPAGVEVLAVNAGSTDGSELVLGEWAARDPRVRVVKALRCTEADALNAAALRATGTLVGFMHARAFMRPNAWALLEAAVATGADVVLAGDGLPVGPLSPQQAIAACPRSWTCWVAPALLRAQALTFSAARLADDLGFSMGAVLAARTLVATQRLFDGVPAADASAHTPAQTLAFFSDRMRASPAFAGPLSQAALAEIEASAPPSRAGMVRWELERLRARAGLGLLLKSLQAGSSWTAEASRRLLRARSSPDH